MYARVLAANLIRCRVCLLFLAISRKRLCQIHSTVDNSIIVLIYGGLVLKDLTEKSTNFKRGYYDYVKMITPGGMTNFWANKAWQTFMSFLSPPIMNEIFMLRNIPYTMRNPRDLGSQLPKTVYCTLETITYKRPQLCQQLRAKRKKLSH